MYDTFYEEKSYSNRSSSAGSFAGVKTKKEKPKTPDQGHHCTGRGAWQPGSCGPTAEDEGYSKYLLNHIPHNLRHAKNDSQPKISIDKTNITSGNTVFD